MKVRIEKRCKHTLLGALPSKRTFPQLAFVLPRRVWKQCEILPARLPSDSPNDDLKPCKFLLQSLGYALFAPERMDGPPLLEGHPVLLDDVLFHHVHIIERPRVQAMREEGGLVVQLSADTRQHGELSVIEHVFVLGTVGGSHS